MASTLIKTGVIEVHDRQYQVRYFENRSAVGMLRYSAEVHIRADDRVILDDDSLASLEVRTEQLMPATIDSRRLASIA
jgi:hypothetical protein